MLQDGVTGSLWAGGLGLSSLSFRGIVSEFEIFFFLHKGSLVWAFHENLENLAALSDIFLKGDRRWE
jgi:hypothetical protein